MKSICFRLLIIICFIFSAACKKKENPVAQVVNQPPVVAVPVPAEEKSLLPIKLETGNSTINFKYFQQTGYLTNIDNSDGTTELYSYNENSQLKEYDRYFKGEKVYTVYYILDKQGNVIQGNQNKVEYNGSLLTPIGIYKIEYNTENRISKITWYDNSDHIISQSLRTYAANGMILNMTNSGANPNVYNYTSDQKNGWCKQVKMLQVLSIESLNGLFFSSPNNITKTNLDVGNASETSNTYTYNSDNYPESWQQTDGKGVKTTFKITYR